MLNGRIFIVSIKDTESIRIARYKPRSRSNRKTWTSDQQWVLQSNTTTAPKRRSTRPCAKTTSLSLSSLGMFLRLVVFVFYSSPRCDHLVAFSSLGSSSTRWTRSNFGSMEYFHQISSNSPTDQWRSRLLLSTMTSKSSLSLFKMIERLSLVIIGKEWTIDRQSKRTSTYSTDHHHSKSVSSRLSPHSRSSRCRLNCSRMRRVVGFKNKSERLHDLLSFLAMIVASWKFNGPMPNVFSRWLCTIYRRNVVLNPTALMRSFIDWHNRRRIFFIEY